MGSITKRGEYQYRAQVRRNGQKALSKTFELKRDAQAWVQEVERKIRLGAIDDLDREKQELTFNKVIDDFEIKKLPMLAREGASLRAPLDRIREAFGDQFVSTLRAPALNEWASSLKKIDQSKEVKKKKVRLSAQSVIHHLNTISAVINHASKRMGVYLPAGNPAKAADRPKVKSARNRVLRDGEFELLMRAAKDPGDGPGQVPSILLEPIIRLALETSMRQGELLALRWTWIDFKNQIIKLPAESTKNGESRDVALSSTSVAILRELKDESRHISGRVFDAWKDAQSFQKPWQRLLRRARRLYIEECQGAEIKPVDGMLENLRFHDLRHHATTELFSRGLNPFEVASMTGHKSMAMLKRYTHVDAAKLAQKLG